MKYFLLPLASLSTLNAQIKGPLTTHNPTEIELQSKINASSFAEQWTEAFLAFKITPRVNIETVTSKDGIVLTLDNIHTLCSTAVISNTGTGNLLYAVQRIGKRDYTVVLDPRQVRYIRQVKAE
jgi:hypothetical protein